MSKHFQIFLMTGFVFMAVISSQGAQANPWDQYCPNATHVFSMGFANMAQCQEACMLDGCTNVHTPIPGYSWIKVLCCEPDLGVSKQ